VLKARPRSAQPARLAVPVPSARKVLQELRGRRAAPSWLASLAQLAVPALLVHKAQSVRPAPKVQ
jgi:hypothetical protein